MLLIFDWDGTLSDSTSRIIHCLQQAAKVAGFPVLADHDIKEIIGLGLPEAMQRLYPQLNDQEKEAIRQEYVNQFVALDISPSPFFDGVEEGLLALSEQGFKMAVATGKSRKGLNRVLTNLAMVDFFDDSRCADETQSKPHPLMLEELLNAFALEPTQAMMVGDTEYDMEMARLAGVHRVAVSYGAHHIDRLQQYEPIRVIDQFNDFVSWVMSTYQPSMEE